MLAESQQLAPAALDVRESYRMIQSLEITNFRGFRQINLSNLPQFNVLIGESASGKTAFLEALWIQCGISPEIYFRMRAFRGMAEANFQLGGDRLSYEAVFSDIFHDAKLEAGATIQIMDSLLDSRTLTIAYGSSQITMSGLKPQADANPGVRKLVFRWMVRGNEHSCPLNVVNGQIVVENPPELYPGVFFASAFVAGARENAERLSMLNISGEKQEVINTIKKIFPSVEDLSSESISNQQMIWAKMQEVKRRIPMALVSSGINKFISLLLWISLNRNGLLLVDEIENGFYFGNYEEVFRTLVEFCREFNVQLFAATHSWEFLKAVETVLRTAPSNLSMLKTGLHNGECAISQIAGISSLAAIQEGIDPRR
ncbi:MAG TPA: AAA family ATPase [Terriglobales bacterium]|nr:AAA family ATPase [Terriglobales bacterium]